MIVGANGVVLVRSKGGEALRSFVDQSAGIIATVLPLDQGAAVLLAGENGVSVFEPHQVDHGRVRIPPTNPTPSSASPSG